MPMDLKRNKLLKAIEEDITIINEESSCYSNELNNNVDKLIKISKREDRKELYLLTTYEMTLICMTMSYTNRPYEEIKKLCEPLKNSLNAIKHDDKTILMIRDFIDVIDSSESQDYSKYLKRLGLDEEKINNLICLEDYAIFVKPIFLLLSFKNGYEKAEKMGDKRARKSLHQQNFNLTLQDIIEFISKYHGKIVAEYEYFDKKLKLNKELKEIVERGEAEVLSIIPIKKDYLDYLSGPVLVDLFIYISGLLNYSYFVIEDRINDLHSELNDSPFNKILYNMGIDPYSVDNKLEAELSKIEYSLLEKRVKFLLLLGLTPKEIITNYIYYLKTLDTSVIDRITFYLDSNLLSKDNIKNKVSEVSTIFSKINANYEILKPIIDFSNIYYNESLLFEDLTSLKNKLSVLAKYSLTKNHFMFLLVNYEYLHIYDLMLENEIPLYLFINICNTNNPILTIKRIIMYKELNTPYETPTHSLVKDVKFEKYFVCSNEELEYYYPDNPFALPSINGSNITDIKNNELIKRLEDNNHLEDMYIIGDTFISRPKVLRNLQYMKDNNIEDEQYLISSFLTNSITNQGNLLDIKKELNIQKSYLL